MTNSIVQSSLQPAPHPERDFSMSSHRILVLGGTGAQGRFVIDELCKSKTNWTIRVLTRDAQHQSAVELKQSGAEIVQGDLTNEKDITLALQDCYGVFVHIDGFALKPADELFAAIRIFEISKTIPGLQHFLWSGLAYHLKAMDFDPKYGTYHINAKGRFGEFLQSQPSSSDKGLTWTILNSCLYLENLKGGIVSPKITEDGTRAFAFPLPRGHIAFISLADFAIFARLIFEDRQRWSGKTLQATSCFATGQEIAETTSRVSGKKCSFQAVDHDEWNTILPRLNSPASRNAPEGITLAESFVMFFNAFSDDVWVPLADLKMLKELNPDLRTLESWMRENNYDGTGGTILKGARIRN